VTGTPARRKPGGDFFEAIDGRLVQAPGDQLRDLVRHRAFFYYWVRRNLLTRYRQTTLGPVWVILQPLLGSAIYGFVFGMVLNVDTHGVPYPVFAVTNLVLWTYFVRPIASGPAFLLSHIDTMTRIRFPREFVLLAVWVESLVDLVPGVLVLALFFAYYQIPLSPYAALALVVFVTHTMLTLGLTFLFAALSIAVRDLLYIVPILLQFVLYLSPVLYPLDQVPIGLRRLYLLNPLAAIFAGYQDALLYGRASVTAELAVAALVSLAILVAGYRLFKRMEWKLADLL
jgi:ABC-type polysaccharide/polyol phosphate export permease